MKKLLLKSMLLLCALVVGSMNGWATDPVSSLAPTDGGTYVVAAYVNSKYYALPNGAVTGTIQGVEISLNSDNKVSTSVASGKTWTLEEGTGDDTGKFYIKYTSGSDTYCLYKNGTSTSNYNFAVNKTSRNYWTFTANGTGYTVAAVDRGTNHLNIQCNSGTFRCNNTATPIILLEVGDVADAVATPTFSPAGGTFASTQNVTINCSTGGASIYYTTDGTDPSTSSSLYSSAISVSSTTTIKAIATKSEMTNSDIASATYTFVTPLTLPFEETFDTNTGEGYTGGNDGLWSGSIASATAKNDNTGWTFVSGSGANLCVKLGTGSIKGSATTPFIAFESGKTYQLTFKAGAWNGGTEKTTLNLTITNGTLSASSVTMTKGAFTDYSIIITGITEAARIKFEASSASNNRFFLDEVQVKEVSVEAITPATEYSTLTSAKNLDFTGHISLKAYIAKSVSAGKVNLVPVNKVSAGNGILLKATATGSPINVPVFTGDGDDMTGNLLVGSATAATTVAANAGYILKSGVFQPSSGGDLPAGKAYLAIAVGARSLDLNFEDEETTGVNDVKIKKEELRGDFFDLQGRKVAHPTKGLYIVNGKKVIIK